MGRRPQSDTTHGASAMIIAGIDPGVSTGVGIVSDKQPDPILLKVYKTPNPEDAIQVIRDAYKYNVELMVIEQFVVGYKAGVDRNGLLTIQLIGALRALSVEMGIKYHMQNASSRTGFLRPAKLICMRILGRSHHVSDGLAHAMSYLYQQGIRYDHG
jgi:hypothetical protein